MKLKQFILCLAIGLFTFGLEARAAEPKAPQQTKINKGDVKDIINGAFCYALQNIYKDKLPDLCKNACKGIIPSPTADDLRVCAAAMRIAGGSAKPISENAKKVYDEVRADCDGLVYCTMATCSVHKDWAQLCGDICCNIDPSTVSRCMSTTGDKCDKHLPSKKITLQREAGSGW